jgi:hypothetical protein
LTSTTVGASRRSHSSRTSGNPFDFTVSRVVDELHLEVLRSPVRAVRGGL